MTSYTNLKNNNQFEFKFKSKLFVHIQKKREVNIISNASNLINQSKLYIHIILNESKFQYSRVHFLL
jgi:hypothetical protein